MPSRCSRRPRCAASTVSSCLRSPPRRMRSRTRESKPGGDVDPYRIAVIAATGCGGLETFEEYSHTRFQRGRPAVSVYLLPGMLSNMATARIAIKHQIQGYSSAIVTACAAGAQAIAEGLRLIRDGEADVVICGGTESPLHPTIAAAFANARALALWAGPIPRPRSRPFDRGRNGFVLAEGACMFVLERAAFAQARGAAAYADLIGWPATDRRVSPRHHAPPWMASARPSACAGQLPVRAWAQPTSTTSTTWPRAPSAVTSPRRPPSAPVFGAHRPAVSSIKGVTGHLLGASGAVEAAATALAVSSGAAPAHAQPHRSGSGRAIFDHLRAAARTGQVRTALSNSFALRWPQPQPALRPVRHQPAPHHHRTRCTMNIQGIDHVGFHGRPRPQAAGQLCDAYGFRVHGEGGPRTGLAGQRSVLVRLRDIRILLTSGLSRRSPGRQVCAQARRRRGGHRVSHR